MKVKNYEDVVFEIEQDIVQSLTRNDIIDVIGKIELAVEFEALSLLDSHKMYTLCSDKKVDCS